MDALTQHKPALEFKSTTINVPTLILSSPNLTEIEALLKQKIAQAPEFFRHSPLILDLQALSDHQQELDCSETIRLLRNLDFLPIGIRGANMAQKEEAATLNIPVLSNLPQSSAAAEPPPKPPVEKTTAEKIDEPTKPIENMLINHPVRSGQQVYSKADLIVTATVSAGAEIIAEGNIHVYGSLRGKALAGASGNSNCHIFCSDLQAELISIAGTYQVSDEISDTAKNTPVQISLKEQSLVINPLK